ncbi:MAG: CHAT domain-containing protein [Bacteroidota bacterium]
MKNILLFTLLLLSCWSCSKDFRPTASRPSPYQEVPTLLPVPSYASEEMKRDFALLDSIHLYFEANNYNWLGDEKMESLRQFRAKDIPESPNSYYILAQARADRIMAGSYQNAWRNDTAKIMLRQSIANLEAYPLMDESTYYYELACHYNYLAIAYDMGLEFGTSIPYHQKSLQVNADNGFYRDAFIDYLNLASSYTKIYRRDLAKQAYAGATSIYKEYPKIIANKNDSITLAFGNFILAESNLHLANNTLFLGDTSQAVAYFREGKQNIERAQSLIKLIQYGDYQNRLATLSALYLSITPQFAFLGKEALELDRYLATFGTYPLESPLGTSMASLKYLNEALITGDCSGVYGAEVANLKRAIRRNGRTQIERSMRPHQMLSWANVARYECDCGLLLDDQALLQSAYAAIKRAAYQNQLLLSNLLTDTGKGVSGGDFLGINKYVVQIGSKIYPKQSPAFLNILLQSASRSKSTELLSAYRTQRARNEEESEQYQTELEKGIQLSNAIRRAELMGGAVSAEKISALADYRNQLTKGNPKIAQKIFSALGLVSDEQVTVRQIRQKLLTDERTAYVDMVFGEGLLHVFVITANDSYVATRKINPPLRSAILNLYNQEMTNLNRRNDAYVIYQTVMKPVVDWLEDKPEIDQLIIVRNNNFTECSFDYFPLNEKPKARYWNKDELLIERYSIVYGHSAATLLANYDMQQARTAADKKWGIFTHTANTPEDANTNAINLPELDRLFHQRLPQQYGIATMERDEYPNSSPAQFKQYADRYRYLIMSGHAWQDENDPVKMYTRLRAERKPAAGKLSTNEVYGLRQNSDLCFAINCGSGNGFIFNHEGSQGFARAFLAAGSSAVIAANDILIDEHTAEVLTYFFDFWIQEGLPAARALRAAKLKFLATTKTVYPNTWGELIYFGLPNIYYDAATR